MNLSAYSINSSFEPSGPIEFKPDRHYLLYALEGTVRLEADGRRWSLPPARAALIQAGRPISITVLSRLKSASVLFSPDHFPSPEATLSVFDMKPLARELALECRYWGPDNKPQSDYAKKIFQTLADVVFRLARSPTQCVLPVPVSIHLKRALDLTEARAHEAPTLNEIARDTHQSERALARRFHDEIGMTWREALRRIRLVRAVESLAMTDASITEIAQAVGYTSLSGFNAAFRDMFDTTPTSYRESFAIRLSKQNR